MEIVLPPVPTPAPTNTSETSFVLPDFFDYISHFPVRYHPQGDEVSDASDQWLLAGIPNLTPKTRKKLLGVKGGVLAAYFHSDCAPEHLRVTADWLNYLFYFDSVTDGMTRHEAKELIDGIMNVVWHPYKYMPMKGEPKEERYMCAMVRDLWQRNVVGVGPEALDRFRQNTQGYLEAVVLQAADRDEGVTADVESYIKLRRDTGGCRPMYDLIAFSHGFDLPTEVIHHPVLKTLNNASNDLIIFSNDVYSYNVEQSRRDTHNLVAIMQITYGLSLQQAIDYVGDLCKITIDTFTEYKARVPSFGDPDIDTEVEAYVEALQDWIVGIIYWSFATQRYFGEDQERIRKERIVTLLPKCSETITEDRDRPTDFRSNSYQARAALANSLLQSESPTPSLV